VHVNGARRAAGATATAITLALLGSAGPAAGQSWSGWDFYWENDTWVFVGGSDDAFTNGLRLVLARAPNNDLPLTRRVAGWLSGDANPTVGSSLIIGQNFFTPREITDYEVDPSDRPYAGLVYVGARVDLSEEPILVQNPDDPNETMPKPFQIQTQQSVELDVGVLGQGAGSRLIQAGVHGTVTTHRHPKGWSHQIQNSLALSLLYMHRWRVGWHFFDVTPHAGAMLGTTQTYPFAGLTTRVGYGMTSFPTALGRNTAAGTVHRRPWEVGVLAGVEGRYMLRNSFVEGSLFGDEPGVEPERTLGDYRLGMFVRLLDWRLSYMHARRSPEVDEPGLSYQVYDSYGSISLGYEPGSDSDVGDLLDGLFETVLPAAFDGFYLEAGFGSEIGKSREPGIVRAQSMRGAAGRRLGGPLTDLDLGIEVVGVGREFGPAPSPDAYHRDRFLVSKLLTLRYRPAGGRYKKFDGHIRGGVGRGHDETEFTPSLPGPQTTPCPEDAIVDPPEHPLQKAFCNQVVSSTSYMLGGGIAWRPVGTALGVGLDLSWNTLGSEEDRRFWRWSVGMRWMPYAPR
jgi:hypothetical protein